MARYRQLSLEERFRLAELRRAGASLRQIAAALDRSPSTISRELSRNSGPKVGYQPVHAGERAWARRWSGSRLDRDAALRDTVIGYLRRGWSPEQIAGRLTLEAGHPVISHETLYRFVYAQIRRTNDGTWRHYLPRAKYKRGRRRSKGGSPALHITARVGLDERPTSADDRTEPGHWEGDFIAFSAYGHYLLAAHERSSRAMLLARAATKEAQPVADQLIQWLAPLPETLRRSITFDNGTEFAQHHRLRADSIADTFFCEPHSPWQKGGVENAIGRLRRYLPRKTNLDHVAPADITAAAQAYNNTPRRCLGYKTPAEVFQLLHFDCESTSRPSPG